MRLLRMAALASAIVAGAAASVGASSATPLSAGALVSTGEALQGGLLDRVQYGYYRRYYRPRYFCRIRYTYYGPRRVCFYR